MQNFFFKIFQLIGHPCFLFSENKKKVKNRWILTNIIRKKINVSKKFKSNLKENYYVLNEIFFPFLNEEIRKKRLEFSIKKDRNAFSFIGIKNSIYILSNIFSSFFKAQFKNFIFKNEKKKKEPNNLLKKKFISSSCFLNSEYGLLTGSFQGKVDFYSIKKKNIIFSFLNKLSPILNLSNHPNITSVVCICQKNELKFLKISPNIDFFQLFSLKEKNNFFFSKFRKDGQLIDVLTSNNNWKTFDIEKKQYNWEQKFSEEIFCIENNKYNSLIAIGSKKKLMFFDQRVGKIVLYLQDINQTYSSVKWAANSNYIFTSGYSNVVKIWDIRKKNEGKICGQHKDIVSSISTHSNSKYYISSDCKNKSKIWSQENFLLITTFKSNLKKIVKSELSLLGCYFSTIDINNNFFLFNL
jgi:WD40 repeat protein